LAVLSDYEELTAEILMNGEYIVLIQKEGGNDKMIVEFYEKRIKRTVYLNDFIECFTRSEMFIIEIALRFLPKPCACLGVAAMPLLSLVTNNCNWVSS